MDTMLTGEEKLELKKAEDKAIAAYKSGKSRFTAFLNPKLQLALQQGFAKKLGKGIHMSLSGGYAGAERQLCAFFPEGEGPEKYPITALRISCREASCLNHRDYMGSLLALGIQRDILGDILPDENGAVVFVLSDMAGFIAQNLLKIGRFAVSVSVLPQQEAVLLQKNFLPITGTVASVRLDALVSLLTGLSRSKCEPLLAAEKVMLNYTVCQNGAKQVKQDDVLTVRGYGKAKLAQIGGQSKKGRYFVTLLKYQ